MSLTGYKTTETGYSNTDLVDIFQPTTSGTIITNYLLESGADIGTIFAPYTSGTKANLTGYNVGSNSDLADIFQIKFSYEQTGGIVTNGTINSEYYNTIITFNSGSNGTFTVLSSPLTINYFIVGAGGSGGGCYGNTAPNFGNGAGGGGGGGGIAQGTFTPVNNVSYTITPAPSNSTTQKGTEGATGSISSINGDTINIIANGGSGGKPGQQIVSGSGGNSANNYTGGTGSDGNNYYAGGGGGNAGNGGNGGYEQPGVGGPGTTFNSIVYAIGGGGGVGAQSINGNTGESWGCGGGGGGFNNTGIGGKGGGVILYFNF